MSTVASGLLYHVLRPSFAEGFEVEQSELLSLACDEVEQSVADPLVKEELEQSVSDPPENEESEYAVLDRFDVDDLEKMFAMALEKEVLERSVFESDLNSGRGSGCAVSSPVVFTRALRARRTQENTLFRSSIFSHPTMANSQL